MKLNGVILLTDQGEIVENPDAAESVILILDVLSLKILIKEIFTLQFKKIWFFVSFLVTATYFRNEVGLSKFYSKSIFEIYDTFESIPARVEFDTNKVSIKKKIFLLSNPLSNEN